MWNLIINKCTLITWSTHSPLFVQFWSADVSTDYQGYISDLWTCCTENIIVIHPSDVILYLFQLLTTWNGVVRKRKYLRNIGYAPKKMAASLVGRVGRALKELENVIALAFGKQFPPRK